MALQQARRGRKSGQGAVLTPEQQATVKHWLLQPVNGQLWSREHLVAEVQGRIGIEVSERSIARLLEQWGLDCPQWQIRKPKGVRNPAALWYQHQYQPLLSWAESTGATLLRAECRALPEWPGHIGLWFQTPQRKQLWWVTKHWPTEPWLISALTALQQGPGSVAVCLKGLELSRAEVLQQWLHAESENIRLISVPPGADTA